MAERENTCDGLNVEVGSIERRWGKRKRMRASASLKNEFGQALPATVIDMTDEGLQILFDPQQPIELFTIYWIELQGILNCQCYAIWRTRDRAGMQLSVPIHPSVVVALVNRFPMPLHNA